MKKKKILLVDDSSTVLMLHQMMLKDLGCDLVTARNGREGVEKALAERPDVIFMDVIMPEMNGFEACRQIRAELAETPILMVTTRGEEENVKAGRDAGCTDYITKPFDRAELVAKLQSYLAP